MLKREESKMRIAYIDAVKDVYLHYSDWQKDPEGGLSKTKKLLGHRKLLRNYEKQIKQYGKVRYYYFL